MTKHTAWKAVNADGTTRGGYRWPMPTNGKAVTVHAPLPEGCEFTRGDPCPRFEGDGLCLALTFAGAGSGGIPAHTGLVVTYEDRDVLGADADKVRVSKCRVLDVFDVWAVVRAGFCADLRYVDLRGADLRGADLRDADLRDVNLRGADLRGANLRGADLRYVNLRGADLRGADLGYVNLRDAWYDETTVWPTGFVPPSQEGKG